MTQASTQRSTIILRTISLSFFAISLGLLAWVGATLYLGKSPTGEKALIGGAFTATTHRGEQVSDKDFLGKYSLVYFGYTFCPDVCPGELQIISAAMDLSGETAKKITPLFFSVDPTRDTPEVLADYVPHFHDDMVGLTGTKEQMAKAAKTYRVYYAKAPDDAVPGGYLMDHSSLIYLMDPRGEYVRHFNYGTMPEEIAAALQEIIQ